MTSNTGCWRRRLAVLVIATNSLSGCATDGSEPGNRRRLLRGWHLHDALDHPLRRGAVRGADAHARGRHAGARPRSPGARLGLDPRSDPGGTDRGSTRLGRAAALAHRHSGGGTARLRRGLRGELPASFLPDPRLHEGRARHDGRGLLLYGEGYTANAGTARHGPFGPHLPTWRPVPDARDRQHHGRALRHRGTEACCGRARRFPT